MQHVHTYYALTESFYTLKLLNDVFQLDDKN